MNMNMPIARVTLPVSDQERAIEFYTQVFGMSSLSGSGDSGEHWREFSGSPGEIPSSASSLIDSGGLIELHVSEQHYSAQGQESACMEIAGASPNRLIIAVVSMQKTTNQIMATGGTVTSLLFDIDPRIPTHAIATDADGNVMELVEAASLLRGEREATMIGLGLTTANLSASLDELCRDYGFSPGQDKFSLTLFKPRDNSAEEYQIATRDGLYLALYQYRESARDSVRPGDGARNLYLALTNPRPGTDSTDQQF